MQIVQRHMVFTTHLLATLLFVASSGFSLAISYCTMGGGAGICSMGLAGMVDVEKSGDCGDSKSADGTTVGNNMTCMVTKIAGGFQTDPTTLDRLSVDRQMPNGDGSPSVLPPSLSSLVADKSVLLIASSSPNAFPPSVEKYILTCTFLI